MFRPCVSGGQMPCSCVDPPDAHRCSVCVCACVLVVQSFGVTGNLLGLIPGGCGFEGFSSEG